MIFGYSVTYSEVGGQLLVNFMQRLKVAPFNRGSCRINLKRRKVCVVTRKPTSLNSKAFTYNKDIISYKISNHNNSLTTNCFLPSNLFLIVLMRWGVSERTNILRDSSHGWVKNGWHLPLTPLMPRSDHIFRFVVAPSEISPWTIAPTFSSNIIALITIFANSVPLTGPLDAKIAIGWAYLTYRGQASVCKGWRTYRDWFSERYLVEKDAVLFHHRFPFKMFLKEFEKLFVETTLYIYNRQVTADRSWRW